MVATENPIYGVKMLLSDIFYVHRELSKALRIIFGQSKSKSSAFTPPPHNFGDMFPTTKASLLQQTRHINCVSRRFPILIYFTN